MLRHGLEAGGVGSEGEAVAERIEACQRTGRPLASEQWIEVRGQAMGRQLKPAKPGPKPGRKRDERD